jgi:TM2 domain-containing membrane protein YozV
MTQAETKKQKSEVIAIIISAIISGVGEIYLGKIKRGLAILAGGIFIGVLSNLLLVFAGPGMWFLAVIYWIWQLYDTHKIYQQMYTKDV